MSKITDLISKSGIQDLAEISMLEDFFNNPEIVSELQEAEKNRKKRQLYLIIAIPLVVSTIFYFSSLGIINIEVGDNTGIYRPSEWSDGLFRSIFASIITFSIIKSIFNSKIEGAIKNKILSKLSKKVYENLEYDSGSKYAFNDLQKLVKQNFLNSYEDIDFVEDSLAFTIKSNGKVALVQGYELQTSITTRDSKGRSHKNVTNHSYLLKIRIPKARIKLENNMYIKTDESDSSSKMPILYGLFGGVVGGLFGVFSLNINLILGLALTGLLIGFIGRIFYLKQGYKKRVVLENIEFEKMFDVQCEDQIGSRMIITPAFMDRLVSFTKNSKFKYEFLFTPDCFYVKWDIYSGYLEVNTWKNIVNNIGNFVDWYIQMKNIISLIIDIQIIYLSKTDSSFLDKDMKFEYETFSPEISKLDLPLINGFNFKNLLK